MFAIGHFALGYLSGKSTSTLLKTKINLPLLFAVSVIPDLDLVLGIANPTLFMHRGITHSLATYALLMIPLFLIYRKQAVPYFAVLLSHSLLGDFFNGGIELFWPFTQEWFGNHLLPVGSLADTIAELMLFAATTVLMFRLGDLKRLVKPGNRNWLLIIGFGALLGPLIPSKYAQGVIPWLLIPPSLFWLIIFGYSILNNRVHKSKDTSSSRPALPIPGS